MNGSQKTGLDCTDSGDFKQIYDATFPLLFKVSYKIVEDEEAAEDLVHDSFIKANEKNMIFPSVDDAKFWLICVVKNASLNYAKRKLRETRAYHKALYEGRQHIESGEVDLLKSEARQIAIDALNKLPENLREVLVLREYADMNYKEIGKALGISEGNVKVRAFRAREQLIKIIGEENVYLS
ncbi:sigma-70 family RNA polymerase sigma factor [Treponema sp.]|uniref:RNA polymerase sigma factor n=1 Tax=Treponema sp. TaxID=166 RepID=UPI0025F1DCC7|nr:sigma-70 family RNA polymerase sigma factor [Treponema sp.]MCR5217208.1 sigma-70 family RNA polymerase sigma factor [Treponema sp.]